MLVYGALGTRSSALFDVEGDGDLDIVTNEFNGVPLVLLSDLSQRRTVRYVEVVLVGKSSNRDGLGAVVAVEAGDQVSTQVQDGHSGYLSQSVYGLYFGLGRGGDSGSPNSALAFGSGADFGRSHPDKSATHHRGTIVRVVREPPLHPLAGFDKLSPHCADQSRALSLSKRIPDSLGSRASCPRRGWDALDPTRPVTVGGGLKPPPGA